MERVWTEIEIEFKDSRGNMIPVTVGAYVEHQFIEDMTFTASNGADLTDILIDNETDYYDALFEEYTIQKTGGCYD